MPKDVKKEKVKKPKVKKPGLSLALQGNQNGLKLKDEEVRKEAYRQYCEHIASGYPKQAFFFSHPTLSVCWKTMDKYIADNPEEFPIFLMEQAKSRRYLYWLGEGKNLMQGHYKNGSPVVWQTIMRNIFKDEGWDQNMQITNHHETDARKAINHYESPASSK